MKERICHQQTYSKRIDKGNYFLKRLLEYQKKERAKERPKKRINMIDFSLLEFYKLYLTVEAKHIVLPYVVLNLHRGNIKTL